MTDGLRVDMSGVKASAGFEPIPRGTYVVKPTDFDITEVKGAKAKNPGAPMINTTFTVQEGEYSDRKVFTNFVIVPDSLPILKAFLLAIGEDPSSLEGELDLNPESWMGKELKIKVKVRPENEAEGWDASNAIQRFYSMDDEDAESGDKSLLPS